MFVLLCAKRFLVRETVLFQINGWVLLPDHLHAIWTLPEGDADFSTRWRLIKRHVTRACGDALARPDYLTERRAAKQCGTFWLHRSGSYLVCDFISCCETQQATFIFICFA